MAEIKTVTPKGGRKGGATYPRINLEKAVNFAKKLVSKTHTGPQPANVILPGVFGDKGGGGRVRASALKQYNLLEGSTKGYCASNLAKQINAATEEELPALLNKSFLKPKIFKTLFDTFCSDEVTRAKIKQQASNLNVHPDSSDDAVSVFVESAIFAGLASETGDSIDFYATPAQELNDLPTTDGDSDNDVGKKESGNVSKERNVDEKNTKYKPQPPLPGKKPSALIEFKIDSSMDPEKLEKHLAVLRKYGQI